MKHSQLNPFLRMSGVQLGIILAALVISLSAGATRLVSFSTFSPLLVAAFLATLGAGFIFIHRPVWAVYLAVFILFIPIGIIPSSVQSLLNRGLAVTALVAWIFNVLYKREEIYLSPTLLLMSIFLFWNIASLAWTKDFSLSLVLVQTYALRLGLFILLVPSLISNWKRVDGLMTVTSIVGWLVIAATAYPVLRGGYATGERLRVFGENENSIGILAILGMTGVIWQAMKPGSSFKLIKYELAAIYLISTIGLIAMSGSRGSAISLGILLVAFCAWRPTRPWGIIGLLILVIGMLASVSIFSTTLERFAVTSDDTLLGGREALWKGAWQLILDHFWLGIGIGNSPYAIAPYIRTLRSISQFAYTPIHNPVLVVWAETGLAGIAVYLGILASSVWAFIKIGLQMFSKKQVAPDNLEKEMELPSTADSSDSCPPFKAPGSCNRPAINVPALDDKLFLLLYYALISSLLLAYMASWIKGGGAEFDYSYFLLLSLLMLPERILKMKSDATGENLAGRM